MRTQIHQFRRGALTAPLIAVAAVLVALVSLGAAPAWSAVGAEQQGAALVSQIQSGQTGCSKLSTTSLALVGEYEMGRIMGSSAAQNAMKAQLLAITGVRGEQRAYQFMGERMAGCATGNGPVAFGTMMGMMGTSEMGASYGAAYPARSYGSSMMGGYGYQTAGRGDMSGSTIVAILLGALVLLALLILLGTRRTPRLPTQPRAA